MQPTQTPPHPCSFCPQLTPLLLPQPTPPAAHFLLQKSSTPVSARSSSSQAVPALLVVTPVCFKAHLAYPWLNHTPHDLDELLSLFHTKLNKGLAEQQWFARAFRSILHRSACISCDLGTVLPKPFS